MTEDSNKSNKDAGAPIIDTAVKKQQILAIYSVALLIIFTGLVILAYFQAPLSILGSGDQNIKMLIYTAAAGGIGGTVYNMRTFTSRPDTIEGWFIWYLLMPLGSIFFGVFAYVLVSGGVLVLSSGGTATEGPNTTFFYVGLAFLAGFATEQFIKQLTETANVVFQPASRK